MPSLSYEQVGSGPPVVFIHGFLESCRMWDDLLPHFTGEHTCVLIDLPGHGASTTIDNSESIQSMAEKVLEVVQHLNYSKVPFIGHSMGGYVSTALACTYPEVVARVCLLNSHVGADNTTKVANRERLLRIIRDHYHIFVNESIPGLFAGANMTRLKGAIEEARRNAMLLSPDHMAICTKAMKERPDLLVALEDVEVPISFIAGDQDSVMEIDMIRRQHEALSKSVLHEISGCGHMSHLEAPLETTKLLRTFLGH